MMNTGLLSDRQIKELVAGQNMIDPFVDHQVRTSQTGEKLLSYGLSSYGYDMRLADEFRIFTTTPYNTVVDPKNMDERCLVAFQGEICIIPPNSYALGRSIEKFTMPIDVAAICVGKSTYARCFSGDTRVALVNRKRPTLESMAEEYAKNQKQYWGYGVNADGLIRVTELIAPRWVGVDSLLEITLDDGSIIRPTPDHQFLRRYSGYDFAYNLRPGDSLFPLYRSVHRVYESVYQPTSGYGGESSQYQEYAQYNNHKIASITELPGQHDVYCVSAPETENFALEAGVMVHNCGLICNVTPLEAGWIGHLTIELSNSTPLPIKVYANEGIAQLLFLRGSESCEVSYADRAGKYQGQTGITLPKL